MVKLNQQKFDCMFISSILQIKKPAICRLFNLLVDLTKKLSGFIHPAFVFRAVFAGIGLGAGFKLT